MPSEPRPEIGGEISHRERHHYTRRQSDRAALERLAKLVRGGELGRVIVTFEPTPGRADGGEFVVQYSLDSRLDGRGATLSLAVRDAWQRA